MLNYLKEKQSRLNEKDMDFYTPTGLHVFFQHPVENVDVEKVINKIESIMPSHMLSEIEMIIFGWFDEFEERSINAFYNDNAIYVSHIQQDEADLFDDLVHEISHSLEEAYGYQIYADDKIKNEFLRKRRYLHDILWKAGFKAPLAVFTDIEYSQEFDEFLHQKVGYDKLAGLITGLFIRNYTIGDICPFFIHSQKIRMTFPASP